MTVLYTDICELVTNDPANADGDPHGIVAVTITDLQSGFQREFRIG